MLWSRTIDASNARDLSQHKEWDECGTKAILDRNRNHVYMFRLKEGPPSWALPVMWEGRVEGIVSRAHVLQVLRSRAAQDLDL